MGYHVLRDVRVFAEVLDVFNKRVNDIDYYYASQLKGETSPLEADGSPGGINDHHLYLAESRTVRLDVLWIF